MTQKQEQLVLNNTRLVYRICESYRTKPNYEDLVSEGMLGLCIAATKFDELRGNSFTTFAYMHILGRIMLFVYTDTVVRPGRKNGKYLTIESCELTPQIINTWGRKVNVDTDLDASLYFAQLQKLLDDESYNIVKLLYLGYRKSEILRKLKINAVRFNRKMTEIKNKLQVYFKEY